MSYRCDRCGKGRLIGRNIRHKKGVAGGQWKKRAPKTRKISLPNLQSFKGVLNGKKGKWRLCTRCLKTVKKQVETGRKVDKSRRSRKSSKKEGIEKGTALKKISTSKTA